VVTLVKPQFEVGRAAVGKGGIVRDEVARAGALVAVADTARALGFAVLGQTVSPITGGKGKRGVPAPSAHARRRAGLRSADMARIVVTGAAGFIGSHLAERLCARGDQVLGFDNFDAFYPRAVKERNLAGLRGQPGFRLHEGTSPTTRRWARRSTPSGPSLVLHLGGLAGVRPSVADPLRFHEVNVTGTLHLLAACRARGIDRLVLASSSSVYGMDTPVPFREDAPCDRPASPYAASKRAMEVAAFPFHHLWGMGITCLPLLHHLRGAPAAGPRHPQVHPPHRHRRPVPLFGDGSTSRDYTFIDDIVDGTVAAADEQRRDGGFRIYNLGGSEGTTLARLVDLISQQLGRRRA